MTETAGALEVTARRRAVRVAVAAVVVVALLAVAWWYVTHPPALPTTEGTIDATTPVDEPVYVGAFTPGAGFDRSLTIDGVKVHATSNTEPRVVPLLCVGGAPGVTSTPEPFCEELVDPEGRTLGPDDSLVLEVSAGAPAVVVIDRIRIGYQDGLQAATQDAGAASVIVRVLGR